MKRLLIIVATIVLIAAADSAEAAREILDAPGAQSTQAHGIEGANIVGNYDDASGRHGFLYNDDEETWITLDKPGATGTGASDISGANIVGYYDISSTHHGFLYDGESWTTLDVPGSWHTLAEGIDGRNIVGRYEDNSHKWHGFLYDGTTWTTLDQPDAGTTYAFGIDGTNIVGYYSVANTPDIAHGFLYDGATWITLDAPRSEPIGGGGTSAYAIDGTNVVGYFTDASFNGHGFFYDGTGKWTTLNAPGPIGLYALGIDGGNVVGWYNDGSSHGFICNNHGPKSFQDPDYWSVYDAPVELSNPALKGFVRAAFDGQFVYFPPYHGGDFLRYDTHADAFDEESAWEDYRPGDALPCDVGGYNDAIHVGQYMYFCPCTNGGYHGVMLRYDTHKGFAESDAWKCFDPSVEKPDPDLVGFAGIAFDGQYLYFPSRASDVGASKVLRYDTNAPFEVASSWDPFDLKDVVDGTPYYGDCAFDGQYLYLATLSDTSGPSGMIIRYDTSKPFADTTSWEFYDPGIAKELGGIVCDSIHNYLYFIPYQTSDHPGTILRFNTMEDFNEPESWDSFDAADILGSDSVGYHDGAFDGRHIYFSPRLAQNFKEVLRYDTREDFLDSCSWDTFTPPDSIITDGGYVGGVSDGRYVYFTPWYNSTEQYHGKVLRFDTAVCGDEGHPYPAMDFNKDCIVSWADFAMFASHWLECTSPKFD